MDEWIESLMCSPTRKRVFPFLDRDMDRWIDMNLCRAGWPAGQLASKRRKGASPQKQENVHFPTFCFFCFPEKQKTEK